MEESSIRPLTSSKATSKGQNLKLELFKMKVRHGWPVMVYG